MMDEIRIGRQGGIEGETVEWGEAKTITISLSNVMDWVEKLSKLSKADLSSTSSQ